MELIPAKCPNCGADIQIPEKRDTFICDYCKANIIVKNIVTTPADRIKNMYELASSSDIAYDHTDAYKYYTLIIEHDASEHRAWYGRAKNILCLSETGDFKIDEAAAAFGNCFKYSPADKLKEYKAAASAFITKMALSQLAPKGLNYISHHNLSDIYKSLHTAYIYNDENIDAMIALAVVCYNYYRNDTTKLILELEEKIKKLDPSYLSTYTQKIYAFENRRILTEQNDKLTKKKEFRKFILFFIVIFVILVTFMILYERNVSKNKNTDSVPNENLYLKSTDFSKVIYVQEGKKKIITVYTNVTGQEKLSQLMVKDAPYLKNSYGNSTYINYFGDSLNGSIYKSLQTDMSFEEVKRTAKSITLLGTIDRIDKHHSKHIFYSPDAEVIHND